MNCKTCSDWILNYESLNKSQQNEMMKHMEHCSTCIDLYNNMQLMDKIIATEKSLVPSFSLTDTIMDEIETINQTKNISFWQNAVKPTLVAASISLAIYTGFKTGSLYSTSLTDTIIEKEFVYLDDASMESLDSWIME